MSKSLAIDDDAFALIEAIAGTPHGRITWVALQAGWAKSGRKLLDAGLLVSAPDEVAVTANDDFADAPVTPVWDAERQAYGYFSPLTGWESLEPKTFTVYQMNIPAIVARLLGKLDAQRRLKTTELATGCIWEAGDIRVPGRKLRVPVWVAFRLSDPVVWDKFNKLVNERPSPGLRLVLCLTQSDLLPKSYLAGHEIVAVRSVLDGSRTFAIDSGILAARLAKGGIAKGPVTIAADGASITVLGKLYTFPGSKQRAIIRHLFKEWNSGQPECLTVEVLEGAGFYSSVNTLGKAFSKRKDWREFIEEKNGRCWIFT